MIRYIYTFFVGLFLALFIGVGVAVFYTEPQAPDAPNFYGKELTAQEQSQQKAFDIKQKAWESDIARYNRNASIIVLMCAVIVLTISLVWTDKLGIVADGLLMGGIFTLLYGIGRGMAADSNKYRFAVTAVGLVVTLVLGYLKFTAGRLTTPRDQHAKAAIIPRKL